MSKSSEILKRSFDIGCSVLSLIGLSPLFLIIAVTIKLTSKGPAIYRQERLGKKRLPFIMYKFRTMIDNAESEGPQLAIPGDPRVTKIGRILRKYHLDELTQLWNVLRGEMSIVGPRPEREVYVTEIEKHFPEFKKLFEVKPGVTSLGMVKYGYASNIKQMIERARFDLDYLKNRSASSDLKVLISTVNTILKGKGI